MSKKSGIGSVKSNKQKPTKGFKQTAETPFTPKKYSTGGKGSTRTRATETTTVRGTKRKGGFKGGARERAQLTWERSEYTLSKLNKRDIKEVRKEYSRIRQIVQKRLKRFEGTEYEKSRFYQMYKDEFKKLKDIKSERELRHLLIELVRVFESRHGNVSELNEQKKKFLKNMQEKYPGIVTENNYEEFIDFMESLKAAGIKYMYDSERFLEFFEERGGKIPIKDLQEEFEKWIQSKNENYKKWGNPNPVSSEEVRKKLKNRSK